MGGLLLVQGKLDEADAEFSQGLVLSRKKDAGPNSLRTAYFLSGLGRVRSRQSRPARRWRSTARPRSCASASGAPSTPRSR